MPVRKTGFNRVFVPMMRHVSQIWIAWILAVTQLGFAVGGDLLHSLNHQIAAVHDDVHGDSENGIHEEGCCCHGSGGGMKSVAIAAPVVTDCGEKNTPNHHTNPLPSWNAPSDHHLCFSSECRFVQITSQQGLNDFEVRVYLDSVNLIVSQELKSQRYSLGTLKTVSSRGPPSSQC
jgi:hypothetical protein